VEFNHERLKLIRTSRNLTQQKLADEMDKYPKTIQRWENPKTDPPLASAPKDTVFKIAKTLDVEIGVLTGDLPMPDIKPFKPQAERSRIGADVSDRTHNAYVIAKKRYGYSKTEIIEMAPLLLAIIAEGSLDFRRQNLEQLEEQLDTQPNSLGRVLTDEDIECLEQEEASIRKKDLFGKGVTSEGSSISYYPRLGNPFDSYLHRIVDALTNNDAVYLDDEYEDSFVNGIPDFTVFWDEAIKLTNNDSDLAAKVNVGIIQLKNMPDELWSEDATENRVAWLHEEEERKNRELEDQIKVAAQSPDNSLIDQFLETNGEKSK